MHKKLTITVDENIYTNLHEVIGRGKISQFIEDLVRPHVSTANLESAYREMVYDELREKEAEDWSEGLIGDVGHEPR